ncbi:MAG: hypothetical protein M3466_05590, partial [Gemmatimonadota bacterium]|nr:hypothetical protein [Gemmatimonadota bacterium]
AGARKLIITHFSARYSRDPSDLVREAREEFENVFAARDGMEMEVPYASEACAVDSGPEAATHLTPHS